MVAHPAVVSRLNWMMGPGWAESPASASVNRMGAGGQQMHGGPRYGGFEASNVSATSLGAMLLVPSLKLINISTSISNLLIVAATFPQR